MLASPKGGNIGDLFDESFSIVPQVTAMCKSASYHLRKNSFIRTQFSRLMQPSFLIKHLLHQTLATVLCYYLVYLSTLFVIKQLQRVQNAAAGVVTLSPKLCHITPVLVNLRRLPTDLRIEFKILIVTYKTLQGLFCLCSRSFFMIKVTSRNRILGLQRKMYFPCLLLT